MTKSSHRRAAHRNCTFRSLGATAACGARATVRSTTVLGPVELEMNLCRQHMQEIAHVLMSVGSTPSVATAAEPALERRAASGRPFCARDVRAWLRTQGECVSERGRLAERDFQRYAEHH